MAPRSFFIHSFAYLYLLPLVLADCYWPNGDVADAAVYKPCPGNLQSCCYAIDENHTDLCYSNGMCYSLFWGRKYRGACQNKNWGSSCASECLDVVTDDGITLTDCWNSHTCCGAADNATTCCADPNGGFNWNNATLDLSGLLATSTATMTVTELLSISGAQTVTPTASQTSSFTSTPTDALSTSALQAESSQCKKDKTALGAGLGASLGVSVLAAAVLGFLLRRQRQRPAHSPPQANPEHPRQELSEKGPQYYSVPSMNDHRSELGHERQIHEMGR